MSKRRTPEQWQALVDQQRDSGLSAMQFCSKRSF
ncbi:IS66 family insertion sequence element accessory protein TnpA [Halovibrio salipaludis]